MRISKFIHACLLVESDGTRMLFDPGKFTFLDGTIAPDFFRDLDAVVVTHKHLDHVDDEALEVIVRNNPSVVVLGNHQIHEQLASRGINVEVFESGTRRVGSCSLEAIVADHARILNAECPTNVAYVVNDRLLHPGDSFDHALDTRKGIELLALPVMAPWNTELAVAEFALRLAPKTVFPIHDGYAKPFFLQSRYDNFTKYFAKNGIEFVGLAEAGASLER